MPVRTRITPCLWFDTQAEEAAHFYTTIFNNSRITRISRYGAVGQEFHGRPVGSVMTVEFELDGQPFTALNGGPVFQFNEAISLQISCDTQAEIDHYWDRLGLGGRGTLQQCGWLKDRYGVSWQVVPAILETLFEQPDTPAYDRVMSAMLTMQKLDLAAIQKAQAG